MLSGGLAQPCSSARLTVHAVLACVRRCSADLKNLRHARSVPQIFRVRGAASDAREHSMYRKSVLTHSATMRQHPATYVGTRPVGGIHRGAMRKRCL